MDIEAGLYTLDEASGLTGLSIEALRKRVTRRKVQAVKGNDGRVRVRLDNEAIAALKREGEPAILTGRPGGRPDGQSKIISAVEAALAETAAVRTDLDKSRVETAQLREQIAAIQANHERERTDWTAQLAAVRTDLDRERSRADRAEGVIEGMRATRSALSGFAAWWRSAFRA